MGKDAPLTVLNCLLNGGDPSFEHSNVPNQKHKGLTHMVSTRNRRRIALQGNLRQKRKNGQFYYRLQVSKGVRKEFALKTSDPDEAVNKAFDLDSLWLAPTAEVAYAQMKAIRGLSKIARGITLEDGWEIYQLRQTRSHLTTTSRYNAKTAMPIQRTGFFRSSFLRKKNRNTKYQGTDNR